MPSSMWNMYMVTVLLGGAHSYNRYVMNCKYKFKTQGYTTTITGCPLYDVHANFLRYTELVLEHTYFNKIRVFELGLLLLMTFFHTNDFLLMK